MPKKEISRPSPRLGSVIADSVTLARAILDRVVRQRATKMVRLPQITIKGNLLYMGQCDLCSGNAGMFNSRHPACDASAEALRQRLHDLVFASVLAGQSCPDLNVKTQKEVDGSKFPIAYFKETILKAADDAASEIAKKSPMSEDELTRLSEILKGVGYPEGNREEMLRLKLFGMPFTALSHLLWLVWNNRLPDFDDWGQTRFNLHHGEDPIFRAGKTTLAEEQTVNTGSRTFGGLSVPVGAGMYYHVGASQGHKVSGLMPIDVGEMLITSQSLYFGGQARTLRIQLSGVLRYQPYVDGVGVCESYGPPKVFIPDYSGMDTGWFFFNLLSALTSKLTQRDN